MIIRQKVKVKRANKQVKRVKEGRARERESKGKEGFGTGDNERSETKEKKM